LTWRNLLSVAHTLTEILLRRISNRIHGRVNGSLAVSSDHEADMARTGMGIDPKRIG
jgi:hypothetical protein